MRVCWGSANRGERATPFQVATSNKHVEVVQLLLEHGMEMK